ncbi:MAG: UDP-N-acetylmuramate dehydrogenase [Bacteroidetes bacterium]|nr:UDP-N-acetylmuramate dehydrogenase [Bacteroidota bacterium]
MLISENFSLKKYNTFGIEANAKYFADLDKEEEIITFLMDHHPSSLPLFILGGGSNILFSKDFEGTVLKVSTKGIKVLDEDTDSVIIMASAGENWDEFVKFCVTHGWGGLENLSLIPGNVGTSPVQNIGAYGVEIKDVLHSVIALNIETLEKRTFPAQECELDYRESIFKGEFKGRYIILNVIVRLNRNPVINTSYGLIAEELENMNVKEPGISDVRDAVIRIRRRKLPDPAEIGNAGSFFKNPVIQNDQFETLRNKFPEIVFYAQDQGYKIPAAWLIEQCGWKGKRFGDAGVHIHQPLILVNYGNATGAEIFTLAGQIQTSVRDKFGIELMTEVNVI